MDDRFRQRYRRLTPASLKALTHTAARMNGTQRKCRWFKRSVISPEQPSRGSPTTDRRHRLPLPRHGGGCGSCPRASSSRSSCSRVSHTSSTPTKNFSYSKFLSQVDAGEVRTASINPSGAITGTLKGGDNYTSQIPTAINDNQLAPTLKAHDVDVTGVGQGSALLADLLSFLPFLLFIAFFVWIGRRSSQAAGRRASWASGGRRPRSTTRRSPRPGSPTSPATRGPSARWPRSSTS